MDVHIVVLSGMNGEDTSVYLKKHGWDTNVLNNEIIKCRRMFGRENPIRVTIWVMLNSPMLQTLIESIEIHIKYVILLYNPHNMISLMRCRGWYDRIKEMKKNMYAILLSSGLNNSLTRKQNTLTNNISSTFLDSDEHGIPHYAVNFSKAIRLFVETEFQNL